MIDPRQLRDFVIRPVLKKLGMGGINVERLLLGTAAVESGMGEYLVQLKDGPARGIWQMEPATARDIAQNYIRYREGLMNTVKLLRMEFWPEDDWASQLTGNLYFACAMARLQYRRFPEPIPDDVQGQAELWKLRYNTPAGKGTVKGYLQAYSMLVAPYIKD